MSARKIETLLEEASAKLKEADRGLSKCPSDVWDAIEPIIDPLLSAIHDLKTAISTLNHPHEP